MLSSGDPCAELYDAFSSPSQSELQTLIHQYLIHHCHIKTAECLKPTLDDDTPMAGADDIIEGDSALAVRKEIRDSIILGDIEKSFALLLSLSLPFNSAINYALHTQQFLELLKQKSPRALHYAQTHLEGHPDSKTLSDVISLLAYTDPSVSPLSHYLTTAQREIVAGKVNNYIIVSNGGSEDTRLESLIKQATVVRSTLFVEGSKSGKGVYQKWTLETFVQ